MTRGTKQQITPHKIDQLKGVGDPANQEVWNNLTLPLEERFESYKHFVAHKVHEIAVGIERAGPEEARVI